MKVEVVLQLVIIALLAVMIYQNYGDQEQRIQNMEIFLWKYTPYQQT